jgi:hypothetical protein
VAHFSVSEVVQFSMSVDKDMHQAQRLLASAVASVVGKSEERAVASLFSPGGTHALAGEFAGSNDFEVVAFLVVLTEAPA